MRIRCTRPGVRWTQGDHTKGERVEFNDKGMATVEKPVGESLLAYRPDVFEELTSTKAAAKKPSAKKGDTE